MDSVEYILGYPITTEPKEFLISRIVGWINEGAKNKYFVCANPHSLQIAMSDRILELALKKADVVCPDGVGVVLASRILGGRITRRVTGSDIFLGLSKELNARGEFSYFFMGSTEATLIKNTERLRKDFPNIRIAGFFSPPFKSEFSSEDNKRMIEAINYARPDVLWIGMTAPKQEKWIYLNQDKLDVKFIGAIGAVFDFYSGKVKRSAPVFRDHGLEWLPRFLGEPRRLWRRNLVSAPKFMFQVIRQRISTENMKTS